MEPSVTETLVQYAGAGEDIENAIDLLATNYVGYAQIVNLFASWLIQIGADKEEVQNIVETDLQEQVIQNFKPAEADAMLLNLEADGNTEWLDELISHAAWRKLIYKLSEDHPDCLLLNFAIKLISIAGYQEEISTVSTASQQLEIFSRVFVSAVDRTLSAMENSIITGDHASALDELARIVCQSEHTYLYSQSLLLKLMQTSTLPNLLKLRNMAQHIEAHAESRGRDTSVFRILFHHSTGRFKSPAVMDALHSMIVKKALNPADINTLYSHYQDPKTAPPVEILKDPTFVNLLIDALFGLNSRVNPEYLSQYVFLLAYASSVFETYNKTGTRMMHNRDDLTPTQTAIEKVHAITSSRDVAFELLPEFGTLLQHMKHAIVSLAVLHWVKATVMEPDFFKLHREHTPLHLALIDEIPNCHLLLHERVFEFFTQLFLMDRDDIDILSLLELRKMLIDRLVHLLYNGYIIPVIRFMRERLRRQDTDVSLVRYFVSEVLEIVSPPYVPDFVQEFRPLVEDSSVLATDRELALKRKEFVECCDKAGV